MEEIKEKIGQEQIHDLLFRDSHSWQSIIYDLINTEQLDPWNVDISLLANKYLEKVRLLEEANFFMSSKVLLAASLLLRIKSEILLNEYIPTLDDILFGKKEDKVYHQERIELDEDIPGLVARTPLPRFKRVTLEELMNALNTAINTETRRIKKAILIRQQEYETGLFLPHHNVNLEEHIEKIYEKISEIFEYRNSRLAFSDLIKGQYDAREKRVIAFVSLLHLDNQQKIWVEQDNHFDEIWLWLKKVYESKNKDFLESLRLEVETYLAEERKREERDKKLAGDEIVKSVEEGEPIEDDLELDIKPDTIKRNMSSNNIEE